MDDALSRSSPPPQSPTSPSLDGAPKKVNKGQINALAKMLSALKSR